MKKNTSFSIYNKKTPEKHKNTVFPVLRGLILKQNIKIPMTIPT